MNFKIIWDHDKEDVREVTFTHIIDAVYYWESLTEEERVWARPNWDIT